MFEDWFYLIAWLRKEQLRGAGRAAARVPSRSNAKQPAYARGGWNSDIHAILRPIQRGMLRFTGFEVLAAEPVFRVSALPKPG